HRAHPEAERGGRRLAVLAGLPFALAAAATLSLGMGAVAVRPAQVVAILAAHAGIDVGVPYTDAQAAVLWAIRLPRVLLAVLVGAALAASGAALQGVFRNPLADPGIIGVSSGAAVGAVAVIVGGVVAFGSASVPVAAFAGALVAALSVYALARQGGRTEVVTLVLCGVAVNAIAGAAIGSATFLADDAQLRSLVFWSLGSLGGATWKSLGAAAPFLVAGTLALTRFGRPLNLLALGEREARHLGLRTERARLSVITLAALTTGAAVAVSGIVGFVGLVVPHLVRLVTGPDHRVVLVASAVGGALALVLADLAARTLAVPAELPLGVVSGAAGGPFFLWLLHRTRRAQGGWA
ncbi:MAG TPA: iron ABC transporter permease, partial [Acidimicrobiales bacterium]|nr:iron ABC transporter permease [Acidimicrobiales bacterium]